METLGNFALGFAALLEPLNLFCCTVGLLLGMIAGLLPILGPVAVMAVMLPATYSLPPVAALLLLVGIFNGALYGAAVASIIAGSDDPASGSLSSRDGRRMAWQGQAGRALATSTVASALGVTMSSVLLMAVGPWLVQIGLQISPQEYFAAIVLTLVASVVLSPGPILTALAVLALGLLLGMVGINVQTGQARMTFGSLDLLEGVSSIAVALGTFTIGGILASIEQGDRRGVVVRNIAGFLPTREDLQRMALPVLRGGAVGSLLGLIPGGSPALASYGAYATEGSTSRNAAKLGQGIVEGVAAPAAAGKAGAQTSLVTMMAFGIPASPAAAILLSAFIIQGLSPGPRLAVEQPQMFWTIVTSVWAGGLLLAGLSLPLMRVWVGLIEVPYRFLYPAVLGLCAIGAFYASNSTTDVYLMAAFGVLGYTLKKFDCNPAPLFLGFILSPLLEQNLGQSLALGQGFSTFFTRPISGTLLIIAIVLLAHAVLPPFDRSRMES